MKAKQISFSNPDERQKILARTRNLKMARSSHAYVRGNTSKFYEWLELLKTGSLPEGPPIWICGDCHTGNLGPIADAKGRVEVQIRDLDQSIVGNPAHDLIRLALSLASAARGSDLPGVTTAKMLEQIMDGYEQAFNDTLDPGGDIEAPPKISAACDAAGDTAVMAPSRQGAHRKHQSGHSAWKAILAHFRKGAACH